jgi:hypothetical protein
MKRKISQKKSANEQLTINYHLWVRAALCSHQLPQSKTLQKQQLPALPTTLIRPCLATNHL